MATAQPFTPPHRTSTSDRWADWESLQEKAHLVEIASGEAIFQQGAPINGVTLLYRGKAKLEHLVISGKRILINVVHPVSVIDLCAIGGFDTHLVSAKALQRSQVGYVSADQYLAWLEQRPLLLQYQLREFAKHVAWFQKRLGQLAYCSVREQLLILLHELGTLAHETSGNGAHGVQIDLFEQEIAEMIGSTRETLVRELSALKKQGLIHVKNRRVVIQDLDLLRQYAEGSGLSLT